MIAIRGSIELPVLSFEPTRFLLLRCSSLADVLYRLHILGKTIQPLFRVDSCFAGKTWKTPLKFQFVASFHSKTWFTC